MLSFWLTIIWFGKAPAALKDQDEVTAGVIKAVETTGDGSGSPVGERPRDESKVGPGSLKSKRGLDLPDLAFEPRQEDATVNGTIIQVKGALP